MANSFFQFKQFTIHQDRCAMKVSTDACLFGAWIAEKIRSRQVEIGKLQVKPAKKSARGGLPRVFDIGAGTGLLSLMIAQKANVFIDTIEIDPDAFEQASENINASPWKERVKIFHADVNEFPFSHKYDIIVSNPPFYENELKSPDPKKNLAHHGGLSLIELFTLLTKNLKESGEFYLMLPTKRIMESATLVSELRLHVSEAVLVKQSPQHDDFRIFIRGRRLKDEDPSYLESEIIIRNDQQQYTSTFIELLKDYYLYL